MAKLPTLEEMLKADRAELLAHLKTVEQAIRESEAQARRDAKAKIEEIARASGFNLADLFNGKAPKEKGEAKYRNPMDHDQTWSGRGRKPRWLSDALDAGGTLEEFAI